MKTISVRVPDWLYGQLKEEAEREKRSMSGQVTWRLLTVVTVSESGERMVISPPEGIGKPPLDAESRTL